MQLKETFERVKRASKSLALLSDEQRNEILQAVADAIINNKVRILEANAQDLAKMEKRNPLYDRLQLTCVMWLPYPLPSVISPSRRRCPMVFAFVVSVFPSVLSA